ncbi:MAG TPA: lytic transglycosylase domain-containing protein [Chitinispirillaceae bacterium]|nr:lytic transglycosylase domain-containing protein [Chitinispirillaceae bacterium]
MTKKNKNVRVGILLHGSKIWISELNSIIFTALLLACFTSLSLIILNNEHSLHNFTNSITALKKENLILKYTLEETIEKTRITELLYDFAGKKVTPHIIQKLTDLVFSSSRQFGYDPVLLLAVIHVESVFDPKALGRYRSGDLSGAMGLMQVKFETAQEMAKRLNINLNSKEDLLNPEVNIAIGVAYLTHLINRFKNFKLGLLAYNQGPQTIKTTLSKNEPLSINYYRKVLNSYYKLQKLAKTSSEMQNIQTDFK